ncbi:major facilitator superfamily domain-containing protein [Dipodascopsis tothii]|uniref:major facilitator superfamily domain-containing protein n=1 Tax=Dipodascopsis tothii TaxID=44089 RepID=UPI0034CF54C9
MGFISRLSEVVGWYPKGMSHEERVLVHKIDLLVLVFACLTFFTKFLDVTALTNAYVSGMKEDLDISGNRLNYVNAVYEVGYCVFQIPSNILITRIPAQYYLPTAEIVWGLFTLGTAFVKNYQQLMAMRFMVGFGATACYVGCTHIVNSWYRKAEIGRRNAIFYSAGPIGSMFSGYIQAAAYTNLNHTAGLEGWRWLFIICTIITVPIAAIGFVFFPDVPERTKSRFLTAREKELAQTRLLAEGFKPSRGIDRTLFKRCAVNWKFHIFVSLLVLNSVSTYPRSTPFTLWLEAQPDKYSTADVDNLGTITSAVMVASALITCYYSDLTQTRFPVLFVAGIFGIFGTVVLMVWDIPQGLKFFGFISLGAVNGTAPVLISWTAEEFAGDLEVRAIAIATYNVVGEMCGLVVPLVFWQITDSPRFKSGYIFATVISIVWLIQLVIPWYINRRAGGPSLADLEKTTSDRGTSVSRDVEEESNPEKIGSVVETTKELE